MNHMSREAVIMIVLVWTVVLANMLYCFYRLLTSKRLLGGDDEHTTAD